MNVVKENMAWQPDINHDELYERYFQDIKNKNEFLSYLHCDDFWSSEKPWEDSKETKEQFIENILKQMTEIDYHFENSDLDILTNIWIKKHSDKEGVNEEFTAFYILKSNGHYLNDIPFQSGDILIVNVHELHGVSLKDADNTMLLSQNGIKEFIDKHMMVANFFNFNSSDNLTKKDIEKRFISLFENDKKPSFSI